MPIYSPRPTLYIPYTINGLNIPRSNGRSVKVSRAAKVSRGRLMPDIRNAAKVGAWVSNIYIVYVHIVGGRDSKGISSPPKLGVSANLGAFGTPEG